MSTTSTTLPPMTGQVQVVTACGVRVQRTRFETSQGEPFTIDELLTDCCAASVTGTSYGLACKGCYAELEERRYCHDFGTLAEAFQLRGCPCPDECVAHTFWVLDNS